MKPEQYDAHVMTYYSKKALAETEVQRRIVEALAGMNSDQIRRVINAAAALNDIDIRIPVPQR